MECDFYECADLIDELKKLKEKQEEDLLRAQRVQSEQMPPSASLIL